MESENTLKNLEDKVQERLENLNDKLDDFSQKYNQISLETKKSKRNKKMKFNSLSFISVCVFILSFITYNILNYTEPELIKEKNKKTLENEVSSLKLFTYSFTIGVILTIFLYFGYYIYKNFRT